MANEPKNTNKTPVAPSAPANSTTDTSATGASSTHAGRRRRKPRRDGKGANARTTQSDKTTSSSSRKLSKRKKNKAADLAGTTVNTNTPDNDTYGADEAALAEGGIKAIGGKKIIPFMKLEKPMAIFSIILVLASLVAIFVNGLNLGLDFTGGVSADVTYAQPVEQVAVVQALADDGFEDAVVQYLGSTKELLVRLPPQSDNVEGLDEALNAALVLPDNTATISNINIIGSQVGNEVYVNSLMAILTALLCMMLYVAVRFQFKLALGALLALFHDAIVTLGAFAIFKFPFDLTVLAAILALIGYSLNDTIVVFDRIRENFRRVRGAAPRQIIDLSLTETLRRTFSTVTTVLLVVLAMYFLGGDGLQWFSVALLIGLVAGTYSSTYISSSIPLAMGLSREDFVVKIKPEFEEEVVVFNDPKAYQYDQDEE